LVIGQALLPLRASAQAYIAFITPMTQSPGIAALVCAMLLVALLALGFIAVATSEFMREATRKPFVITGVVYGHGILKDEQPVYRREGILRESPDRRVEARRSAAAAGFARRSATASWGRSDSPTRCSNIWD